MALFINSNGISQNGTSVGFGGGPLIINGNGITSPNGSALFNTPGNTAISAAGGVISSGGSGGKAFPTPAVGVTTSGSTSGYATVPGAPVLAQGSIYTFGTFWGLNIYLPSYLGPGFDLSQTLTKLNGNTISAIYNETPAFGGSYSTGGGGLNNQSPNILEIQLYNSIGYGTPLIVTIN